MAVLRNKEGKLVAGVSYSIVEFLGLTENEFIGQISKRHTFDHSTLESMQLRAWKREYRDLHKILQGKKGRIIFEYGIPCLGRRIDVVLLIEGKIFVIEYKDNDCDKSYHTDYIRQVNGYALRLKFFHSESNSNWIIPILVVTNADSSKLTYTRSDEDMVYNTIKCNSETLLVALEKILVSIPYKGAAAWEKQWEKGVFKASPTIIDAARNVWRQNNVREFTLGEASKDTRLAAENYIINQVVSEAKSKQKKSICFVTGVPGAGKTLVGLNISVRLQNVGASLLSGNLPLVKKLREALKRDLKKNKKNLIQSDDNSSKETAIQKAEISIETIIQNANDYKNEIFKNRLDYNSETGCVKLKEKAKLGKQHVIIFDEAQRAWNRSKMIKPGQKIKKDWQDKKFPFSEPELFLWDMNQKDWGVFICLVGGGQEINTGEAGICEWLRAIKENPEFADWQVYISNEFLGEEYNSKTGDGMTVCAYKKYFNERHCLTVDDSLYLTACQRSCRSSDVALFIQKLLDCDVQDAKSLYEKIKDKYPIYLTRNVEDAKAKLRCRKEQLLNRDYGDGNSDENVRIGMLMSSKAARLVPLGFEIKKVKEYSKIPEWFLNPSNDICSSNFLEIALNEFFVQGLELDLTAVIWDADFRYNPKTNNWDYYSFSSSSWRPVDKNMQEMKRIYMKNAYRVLLTRARVGMIIVVPEGDFQDCTRKAEFYDSTYNYLKSIGLTLLECQKPF